VIKNERGIAAGAEQMFLGGNFAEVLIARRPDERQVAMTFDQARHQCLAATIDDLRGAVACDLVRAMSDGFDAVAFDQDLTRERRVGIAVPNHNILH